MTISPDPDPDRYSELDPDAPQNPAAPDLDLDVEVPASPAETNPDADGTDADGGHEPPD